MGSGAALALGRVVGSLCVLTAKDGDAQGAMLASWVSQVSRAGWGGRLGWQPWPIPTTTGRPERAACQLMLTPCAPPPSRHRAGVV